MPSYLHCCWINDDEFVKKRSSHHSHFTSWYNRTPLVVNIIRSSIVTKDGGCRPTTQRFVGQAGGQGPSARWPAAESQVPARLAGRRASLVLLENASRTLSFWLMPRLNDDDERGPDMCVNYVTARVDAAAWVFTITQ